MPKGYDVEKQTGCPHCRTGESGYSVFQESCEAEIAQVRKIVEEIERLQRGKQRIRH